MPVSLTHQLCSSCTVAHPCRTRYIETPEALPSRYWSVAYQDSTSWHQIQKTCPSITDGDRKSHRTEDSTHPDTIGEMP